MRSGIASHTPLLATEHAAGYASGWILETDPNGGPVHWHSGSGGAFYATLSLYPDQDLAVAVITNSTGNAGVVQKELTQAILKRHASRSKEDEGVQPNESSSEPGN